MNKGVCWVVIILLMVSCSTEPQNIIPQTSVASIDSPVPANTVFSTPLITPTVSSTPRAIPTKTPTTTPDPILLTQEAEVSACAGSEKNWFDKFIRDTYFMNDQWNAYMCKDVGLYTKVSNPTDEIVWNIPSVDDDQNNPGPEWYWLPFLRSTNGKYLYLKPVCLCYIDGPWLIYSSGFGLSRLDLNTGEFAVWLKPDVAVYSFEFTQDGNLFAFSPPEFSGTIKITDLISGEEQVLSLKESYAILEYRWTPDNLHLVIFARESSIGYSVLVYKLQSEVIRKVVDKNNIDFSILPDYPDEPRYYVSDVSNDSLVISDVHDEGDFSINIHTGEIVKIN